MQKIMATAPKPERQLLSNKSLAREVLKNR